MSSWSFRRWTALIGLALLIVPTLELAVVMAVGSQLGVWPTLGLLIAESIFGALLVGREGPRAWAALRQALRDGALPSGELADGALILVGGTLLLTPGFLTDALGFFFVIPFTRPIARNVLTKVLQRKLIGSDGGGVMGSYAYPPSSSRPDSRPSDDIVQGEVIDGDTDRGTTNPS